MTNDASAPEQLDQEKKIELRLPSKLGYEKVAMDTASSLARRMGFEEAACFGLVYQTAHYALVKRAAVQPGEIVLVTGASGGVGLAAVQLAKSLGCIVVAAVSTPEKAQVALRNGADHTDADASRR